MQQSAFSTGAIPRWMLSLVLALGPTGAMAAGDGVLTLDGETYEFETHGCQFPSGPDDIMASRLPRMAMIGEMPDGRPSRIDVTNQLGQRITFSADGERLYSVVWRERNGDWSSDRGPENGPLFHIEGTVLTAKAHFKSEASGDWVEGVLTASCEQ